MTLAHHKLSDRIESAIGVLTDLLRERPARCAVSGGKDSSVVTALTMAAAERLKAEGVEPYPIILSSSDTGVENPEVTALLHALHESAKAYADDQGFELMSYIVGPVLNEQWWPRLLAGRRLPSYIGGSSDCSVDMKINPQARLSRQIEAEMAERNLPDPVTVLGTRFEESAQRATNMEKRGEMADTVVDGVLAPIADWTTDDVMVFLIDRNIEKFPHDWRAIVQFYGDSAGGECIITPEHNPGPASGCSSRSGCFTCQRVSEDHSLTALTQHDDYAYLRGLQRLGRYLSAIRWDLDRRHWIGREQDPATGCVRIGPNCFSFEECDRLLRMVLTLDRREQERAEAHAADLAAGRIEDTPRNRRMAKPQFCNIPRPALIAIDFLRSVDCFGPPHSALAAWRDVFVEGHDYEVPEIDRVPKPGGLPAPRYASVDGAPFRGMFDPLMSLVADDHYAREDSLTGEIRPHHVDAVGEFFDIDAEAADLVMAFFADEALARFERGDHPISAARFYLRIGTITLPKGYARVLEAHMTRSIAMYDAGINYACDIDGLSLYAADEHDEMIRALAIEHGLLGEDDPLPELAGQRRKLCQAIAKVRAEVTSVAPAPAESLRHCLERAIGLQCALACGIGVFDGQDLKREYNRARRAISGLAEAAGVDQAELDRMQSAAWDRAEAAAQGNDGDNRSSGLYPWIVLGADRASGERPCASRQRGLFEAA